MFDAAIPLRKGIYGLSSLGGATGFDGGSFSWTVGYTWSFNVAADLNPTPEPASFALLFSVGSVALLISGRRGGLGRLTSTKG